jgi:hypothetical protein
MHWLLLAACLRTLEKEYLVYDKLEEFWRQADSWPGTAWVRVAGRTHRDGDEARSAAPTAGGAFNVYLPLKILYTLFD